MQGRDPVPHPGITRQRADVLVDIVAGDEDGMKLRRQRGDPAAIPAHAIMQASYGPTPLLTPTIAVHRELGAPTVSDSHRKLKADVRRCLLGDSVFVAHTGASGKGKTVYPIANKFLGKCWGDSGYDDANSPHCKAEQGATACSLAVALQELFEQTAQDNSGAFGAAAEGSPFNADTLAPENTPVTLPPSHAERGKNRRLDGTYCVVLGYNLNECIGKRAVSAVCRAPPMSLA